MSGEQTLWARRKAAVAAEAKAEQAALEAKALAEKHQALEEKSDAEILDELALPDPDTMKMGDDFSAFMSKAVPDRIRRRALRTLWQSNPVLANVDMLVDYGEDFTDKATVVENMQTAYQIGKGMLKHVEEMARQAEERENPPEVLEEEDEILMAEAPDEALDEAPEETPAFVETEAGTEVDFEEMSHASPTPRRMKLRTEEQVA